MAASYKEYYKIPLNSEVLIGKHEHERCSIEESVRQLIHLLAISHFGECRYNETFGCEIWEIDFDNFTNVNKAREQLRESLLASIFAHEQRLTNLSIEINLTQEDTAGLMQNKRVKKRIDILIRGKLQMTNENYAQKEHFFIAPLSF